MIKFDGYLKKISMNENEIQKKINKQFRCFSFTNIKF